MSLLELFILAVGLSMDAFAVSICKGLSFKKMSVRNALIVGLYFGGFQAGMPLLGYLLGMQFQEAIVNIDHWIAFILLSVIGINMIREALNPEEESPPRLHSAESEESLPRLHSAESSEEGCEDSLDVKNMLLLAIATSIDALAVGVTFAFLRVQIIPAITFIGITTLVLSAIGVKVGNVFGTKYKAKAELFGGVILILMGLKILVEHLFG